jgi:hypothetical protein
VRASSSIARHSNGSGNDDCWQRCFRCALSSTSFVHVVTSSMPYIRISLCIYQPHVHIVLTLQHLQKACNRQQQH